MPTIRAFLCITAITGIICFFSCADSHAERSSWAVFYEETDLTQAASPIPVAGSVLLNSTGIGPPLGIHTSVEGQSLLLRSVDGRLWQWTDGAGVLSCRDEVTPLALPAMRQGFCLFLDPHAIAKLSGLAVTVDSSNKRVTFSRPILPIPGLNEQNDIGDGWRALIIPKPRAQQKNMPQLTKNKLSSINLPPTKEKLNIGVGIGHVQGFDWGFELTANGKVWGGETDLWALVTKGNQGTRLHNSHFRWLDKEGGRGFEGGDLYSEIWGLVKGIRYTWDAGGRWPYLGAYMKTEKTTNPEAIVTYRDAVRLNEYVQLNGEIATDESRYLSVRCDRDPFEVYAFLRHLPSGFGHSSGIFASVQITPTTSIFYGYSSSTDANDQESLFRTLGLRFPLLKRWALTLDRTEHKVLNQSSTGHGVGVTIPLSNKANLFVRYQENSSKVDSLTGRNLEIHNSGSSLISSLSMLLNQRVHIDYQLTRQSIGGCAANQQQLIASFRLSKQTTLQTISGFPNLADSDLLRVRLDHQLSNGLSLILDYGRLSPYQSADNLRGKRGFLVMLKKTWPTWVPARGGEVAGTVTDQLGQPLENITVRLGPYSAITDKHGRYLFKCVPTGAYQATVAEESVPADYKLTSAIRDIAVTRESKQELDFHLIPLGCVSGRVYLDKNGNGRFDLDEGLPDIPVCIADRATATGRDGVFTFCNLEPGRYRIRIAVEALPKRYIVRGNDSIEIELKPDKCITDIEFTLDERGKLVHIMPVEWHTKLQ
ncbi:MAG: carboxypeptidase regulatory-like domain-containing protein [Armatimonadetes bacterium]|nr:carboxypeptidase regulatory-like domain-containing protein [Armatimonadota bacterium]